MMPHPPAVTWRYSLWAKCAMPSQSFQGGGIRGRLHLALGQPRKTHVDHQRASPSRARNSVTNSRST